MKVSLLIILWAVILSLPSRAQKNCTSHTYQQNRLKENNSLAEQVSRIEAFIQERSLEQGIVSTQRGEETIIRIPVVVHNLYHYPSEKVTNEQVQSQIAALNACFRRRNADTANAPNYFRSLGADISIEFALAISDAKRRSTTGIIRKYTPIKEWEADDKMKFASEMGDDAWDPKSYLNIWVCNLNRVAGYSSLPGDEPAKDGIVLDLEAFGTINVQSGYEMGKTAVHEIGHWLGLKHLWGDQYCGDDGIADTPKQAGFNIECPNTVTITCGNGPYGDMYMNFMDLTSDACMNMFTLGQKTRMRSLFAAGGPRSGLLVSTGLNPPLIQLIPVPEEDPRWLGPKLFPNPTASTMTLDLAYDPRWMGKTIVISNLQGQVIMNLLITNKTQHIDVTNLQAGVYFLAAKKDDGESMRLKFVKL